MDNLNNTQANVEGRPSVTPNNMAGTWVPVDPNTLPFTVGGQANTPIQGPDGSFYCVGNSAPQYGQIEANQYNAIPTPSSTVQLPPIVQPIALVPYASQNQPLVQYDPNYRVQEPIAPADPCYRAKAYTGLSVLLVLLAVVAGVALSLLKAVSAGSVGCSGLDSLFGLAQLFGVKIVTSGYYDGVLATVFSAGVAGTFEANFGGGLIAILIPIFYGLSLLFALILVIKYLVKLGKKVSPRKFSVISLLGLIFSVANIIMIMVGSDIVKVKLGVDIGAYVVAAVFLALTVVPFFAKKGAMVVDYEASKRTFINN